MAIRITGSIGSLQVDLTVEGLVGDELASLVQGLQVATAGTPSSAAVQTSSATPAATEGSDQKAWRLALAAINDQQSISSCDLINCLADAGIDDATIKRTLLFLREKGTVRVDYSSDGLQRVYHSK
ncbi:hypothetical protein [Halioxenophilus sp. WMMB6]|uniref:hypothetical protein n=1 Tax=Halioxenophilus sp. WMMB6 TaxID=3073815 RepID=UPI00295E4EDB|nr:hypothetical protein [Halioxenophilus sp. WMMB6]